MDRSSELTQAFELKRTIGVRVAIGLAVLTVLEFVVAVALGDGLVWPWLLPLLLAKAWLIADYFMHVRALREQEAH